MTVTIRCQCGCTFTVGDNPHSEPDQPSDEPGDITTQAHHPAWTDTGLGFTTPALTPEDL